MKYLVGFLYFLVSVAWLPAQERHALVIGNSDYEYSRDLENPDNDAQKMAEQLKAAGFSVTLLRDAKHERMESALKDFGRGLTPDSTALVFYAGHGIQVRGVSYLLPVDAEADAPETLKYEAVALNMVMDVLDKGGQGAGLKIVILDCCRDDPFGRKWRGSRTAAGTKGMAAPTSTPRGTVLCFATDPGDVAKDGAGSNSPYTTGLLTHLFAPGVELDRALRRAGAEVQKMTNREQNPWRNSNFNGEFTLVPASASATTTMRPPARPTPIPTPVPASPRPGNRQPGDKLEVNLGSGKTMVFRWCPPGEFQMGSPPSEEDRDDDETQHTVRLTKGFWMGQTEVTHGEYQAIEGENPSNFTGSEELPVEQVSWEDATGFVAELNRRFGSQLPAGHRFALPTEAQWEYACRAGTTSAYSFGNTLSNEQAHFGQGFSGKTKEVGSYPTNAWGLYDMHGNVWEWCQDWYGEDYPSGTVSDPNGPTDGSIRVHRGGSWSSYASVCRSAFASGSSPTVRINYLGFRVSVSSTQ